MKFRKGDIVLYIPNHANGKITHKDCEYGIVIDPQEHYSICRFFANKRIPYLYTDHKALVRDLEHTGKYVLNSDLKLMNNMVSNRIAKQAAKSLA